MNALPALLQLWNLWSGLSCLDCVQPSPMSGVAAYALSGGFWAYADASEDASIGSIRVDVRLINHSNQTLDVVWWPWDLPDSRIRLLRDGRPSDFGTLQPLIDYHPELPAGEWTSGVFFVGAPPGTYEIQADMPMRLRTPAGDEYELNIPIHPKSLTIHRAGWFSEPVTTPLNGAGRPDPGRPDKPIETYPTSWHIPPLERRFLNAKPIDLAGCYASSWAHTLELELKVAGKAEVCQTPPIGPRSCCMGAWSLGEGGVVSLNFDAPPPWLRNSGLLDPLYTDFFYAALDLTNRNITLRATPKCGHRVASNE